MGATQGARCIFCLMLTIKIYKALKLFNTVRLRGVNRRQREVLLYVQAFTASP